MVTLIPEPRRELHAITRSDVAAAAALVPRADRSGAGAFAGMPFAFRPTNKSPRMYARDRHYLEVGPGVIGVRRRTMAPKVSLWEDDGVTIADRPTRGRISEWSDESRARMTRTLPALDYGPMFAPGNPTAMVTLTLPGQDWEQLVPDLATFKKMVAQLQLQYKRSWGSMPVAVWKMEFQRRGAPHLHLFMAPPRGLSAGWAYFDKNGVPYTDDRADRLGGRTFLSWISLAWAKIVDPDRRGRGFREHVLLGVDVSYKEGERFADPRRIAVYFSKHGQFVAKGYQNEMPEHWRAAILAGESTGAQFWGYWQLDKAIESIELRPYEVNEVHQVSPALCQCDLGSHLPTSDVVRVMRHLRKLARSRSFVQRVAVERWSVNETTGEVKITRRHVSRRRAYLEGQSAGFLVVNDGPAAARDIARLLGARTRQKDYDLVS
jgi:hypothetical protein